MSKFSGGKLPILLVTVVAIAVMANQYRINQYQIIGKWHEMKGRVREKWGDLTDDDIAQARGKLEELVGKIQQKHGGTRGQILRQLQDL